MIINGKIIAQAILDDVAKQVSQLTFQPVLCDVIIGNDPVSLSYVRIKERVALQAGFGFLLEHLAPDTTTEQVIETIERVQAQREVCGLIVQLPVPDGIDRHKVLGAIRPDIDVDCLSQQASALFYQNQSQLVPPTAAAVLALLDSIQQDLSLKRFLVIGQGDLVGKPVAHLLKQRNFKVTTADSATENLHEITPHADVIICGTGQPGLLFGSMVKPGAIVIDAGTAESGGGIVGDVEFDSVSQVSGFISPVPGGVGPVTVAKLLENTLNVAKNKSSA